MWWNLWSKPWTTCVIGQLLGDGEVALETCDSVFSVFWLAVPHQGEWDQDEEGGGSAAEPHQVLPRSVQVGPVRVYLSTFCLRPSVGLHLP